VGVLCLFLFLPRGLLSKIEEKAIMIVRKARKPKGTKETVWNGHEWGVWMRKEWPVAGLASCKSATYLLAREELVDDQWERDK
jgi:hypothetical protein